MKPIATDISSFEALRTAGYLYVDKTDLLYSLVNETQGRFFFISRPRRFGKSLMLSTLKAILEGRRELFEGLKIASADYDWPVVPVLHMDMSGVRGNTLDAYNESLNTLVQSLARSLHLSIPLSSEPHVSFSRLWEQICEQNLQVALLVDEYDIPLQGHLNDLEMLGKVRQLMHDFYSCLKKYSGNIRFLMMTGVSKFAKLSVFSGLNNLTDLTMSGAYAGLLGYTHEELNTFFAEHIQAFAEHKQIPFSKATEILLSWYDNYRFSPYQDIHVLNPVSVGRALSEREIENYWISTGKATLIIERIKAAGKIPTDLENILAKPHELEVCDSITMPIKALLYQAGYLSIRGVRKSGILILGAPNKEVRTALTADYLDSEILDHSTPFQDIQYEAADFLLQGNLSEALSCFRSAIAEFPYEWLMRDEGAVKIAFLMFFYPMNHTTLFAERQTSNGRIDATVETPSGIYIFEFKVNRSAQEALDQVLQNGYHIPYLHKGKPVTAIGLNFNPDHGLRGMDEPAVQVLC